MKNMRFVRLLFGVLLTGLVVSCMGLEESDPLSLGAPEIKTFEVKDNGSLVFELSATVDKNLAGRIAECGFYYGKDKNMNGAERIKCKMLGGSFTTDVTLREYGQTFYVCSYISNGAEGNELCSDVKTVAVNELEEYVEFESPFIVSYDNTSADVQIRYEVADGVHVSEYGIAYCKAQASIVGMSYVVAVDGKAKIIGLNTDDSYQMCAYLKDAEQITYGDILPLEVYGIPVVFTIDDPKKDSWSAELCGEVLNGCGKDVIERGFLWCEGVVETLSVESAGKLECGKGLGKFSSRLIGLKPNVTYSFCAYAVNEEGASYGNVVRFTTGVALPVHGTPSVSDVSSFEVKLIAKVLSDGGEAASEQGFFWGTDSENLVNKVVCKGTEFSCEITSLKRHSTYYVKSYSVNSVGTAYSDVLEFTTLAEYPIVETLDIYDITEYTAMLGGIICDDGGDAILEKGVVWSLSSYPTIELETKTNDGTGTDSFTSSLTELSPNRIYYVRAYATNSSGTSYGQELSFTTKTALPVLGTVTMSSCTSSSMVLNSSVLNDGGETPSEVGFYYSQSEEVDPAASIKVAGTLSGSSFNAELNGQSRATQYYVRAYAVNSAGEVVSSSVSFSTLAELPVVATCEVTDVTVLSAVCGGNVTDDGGAEITAKGVVWSTSPNPTLSLATKTDEGIGTGEFSSTMIGLTYNTKYYVRAYATNSAGTAYGAEKEFVTEGLQNLSSDESANCYIISESGIYAFDAVKGNSSESVGDVRSVEVLWESFGNSTAPKVGDLIKSVFYSDGGIIFQTANTFREGNAVIAAKDASGSILWSWHIWLTDEPGKCVYANNAGTMMDRNLGATSATPGEVGALGLLYQWGRKDPFLGSSSISSSVEAKSTISWPSPVSSSSSRGTIGYALEHPTTFITYNDSNYDWYYTGTSSTDNTRWQSAKTIYDPCPAGWRVPDGGSNGVWEKTGFDDHHYSDSDEGMLFGSGISSPSTWYPAAGSRSGGVLYYTGEWGSYWSVTPDSIYAYSLDFFITDSVYPARSVKRAAGQSVRCLQESIEKGVLGE